MFHVQLSDLSPMKPMIFGGGFIHLCIGVLLDCVELSFNCICTQKVAEKGKYPYLREVQIGEIMIIWPNV